jgi:cytochrome c556
MSSLRIATAFVLVFLSACRDRARDAEPAQGSATAHEHAAAPAAPAAAPADAQPPGNVVQTEMRMLTSILEQTVRGIGVGDVRPIEHELHRLHEAKEATEAALKSGAYKLPKNPEGLEQFEAMDEAFHEQLGALVTASRANDVPAAAEAVGAILRGCPACHAAFRP